MLRVFLQISLPTNVEDACCVCGGREREPKKYRTERRIDNVDKNKIRSHSIVSGRGPSLAFPEHVTCHSIVLF